MSVIDHRWTRYLPTANPFQRLSVAIFGDRLGLTLFLAALIFFALYWRIGIYITDSLTIANTLVNVADGHLYIDHVVYGPDSGVTPGIKIHDGRLYGRNYGLVVVALPFLWGLNALTFVTDLRIALAALWSLLVLALALQLGTLLDRSRAFAIGGAVVALVAFATNVALATPLDPRWRPLIALQTSTMVWAALLAVVVYRLVAHIYDERTAVFAGVATVLATPVGFWASIPKRHVLMAFLAVLTIYCFYRSRAADPTRELRFRALAYVWIALSAWVFPLEALLLLVALGPLDLLTARSNTPRHLAVVGGAFTLALLPFLVTNGLITGDPLRPPGLLQGYNGEEQLLTGGGGEPTDGGGGTGADGGTGSGSSGTSDNPETTPLIPSLIALVLTTADTATAHVDRLWARFIEPGLTIFVDDPTHVSHVFLRSGYIEGIADDAGNEAVTLALLEVTPLLAALLAAPVVTIRTVRTRADFRAWLASPAGRTDLIVSVYVGLIVLAYLPRALGHAQITVRYFLPILPGLVYLIVRLPAVRRAIHATPRLLLFTYAATVLIGGQLLVLALLFMNPSVGEAVQMHAWLGLATAFPLGAWALVATATDRTTPRVGAVLLALAAGATTVFVVLSGTIYFAEVGDFALPIVQWGSERLPIL